MHLFDHFRHHVILRLRIIAGVVLIDCEAGLILQADEGGGVFVGGAGFARIAEGGFCAIA